MDYCNTRRQQCKNLQAGNGWKSRPEHYFPAIIKTHIHLGGHNAREVANYFTSFSSNLIKNLPIAGLLLVFVLAGLTQPLLAAERPTATTNKSSLHLTNKSPSSVLNKNAVKKSPETASSTNSASAQDRAARAANKINPSNPVELWVGLGLFALCLIFALLTRSWPPPLPGWLKWTCRILGGLLIFAILLPIFGTLLALWFFVAGRLWNATQGSALLGALLGQLVGEFLLVSLAIWLFRLSGKKKIAAARIDNDLITHSERAAAETIPAPAPKASAKRSTPRWHSCNVLNVAADARHLWQFDARNGGFALNRQQTSLQGEPLPSGLVGKDWRTLFQPKLNVAWLPPEHVFLRVAQFPSSEFSETVSMVELQLEKLSPLPVAQIVWTIQVLPHATGNMQTVIVIIVARQVVEEFLGQLEGQGYLADRLELPVVDQLQATTVSGDGAWIYPEVLGGKNTGVAAWWYGGVLQNIDLVTLSGANPDALREQLTQMAWAGELEGWLTSPPRWHLVASPSAAPQWEPALRNALDQPIEIVEPVPAPRLAALTAQRATRADAGAGLLPAEFSERYRQQFVDRLWMRGILAVGALYLIGVAIYGTALAFATYRVKGVENQAAAISNEYTNTIKLKGIYQVLNDRKELKYAGLDSWKAVAETMPETVNLESWNFSDGKKLSLGGTVPIDQVSDLRKFEKALRGNSIFARGQGDDLNYHASSSGNYSWSFSVVLKRGEEL